jgi:superfamily I DNA and/or RNA helicase
MVGRDLSSDFKGRREAQRRVQQSRLVFTTCAGAGLGLLRAEEFDTVIVDEASQQTEPETLIPLTKGCKRALLVGDHVQLRATVRQHAVTSGFDVSLFERLYNSPDRPDVAKVMLDTQYRMHPDICRFSSNTFYDSRLLSADSVSSITLPPSQFPWPKHARKVFV